MAEHGLKPGKVATAAGISRQHLLRLRHGTMVPTLTTAKRIADTCGQLARRVVHVGDVFSMDTPTHKDQAPRHVGAGRTLAAKWFEIAVMTSVKVANEVLAAQSGE